MTRKGKSPGEPARKATEEPVRAPSGTPTLTKYEQPALTLAPREPVTRLRFFGSAHEPFSMPESKALFTIGTGACDLVIQKKLSPRVSGFHATLERVDGTALHVKDQQSKNGTFRTLGENRLASFHVRAGESFWLANLRLLPMDTQLEVLRPHLARCLGLDSHDVIDETLEMIATGAPLALIGPPGTDAARLAEAIHDASPQRLNFLLKLGAGPLPSLDHARGGTVFLDLDQIPRLTAPWVAPLFDPKQGLRAIFAATTDKLTWQRLDTYRDKVKPVALVPLARRPGDVVRLMALHWIDELRTGRRVEELGPGLEKIAARKWVGNLDELREASVRLHAYLEHGALRGAAVPLGLKHQSLSGYFQRLGFTLRDQADR